MSLRSTWQTFSGMVIQEAKVEKETGIRLKVKESVREKERESKYANMYKKLEKKMRAK